MSKKLEYFRRDNITPVNKSDAIVGTKPEENIVRAKDLESIKEFMNGKADNQLLEGTDWSNEVELKALMDKGDLINIITTSLGSVLGSIIEKTSATTLTIAGIHSKADGTNAFGKVLITWSTDGNVASITTERTVASDLKTEGTVGGIAFETIITTNGGNQYVIKETFAGVTTISPIATHKWVEDKKYAEQDKVYLKTEGDSRYSGVWEWKPSDDVATRTFANIGKKFKITGHDPANSSHTVIIVGIMSMITNPSGQTQFPIISMSTYNGYHNWLWTGHSIIHEDSSGNTEGNYTLDKIEIWEPKIVAGGVQ